jgi:hypothetical protein
MASWLELTRLARRAGLLLRAGALATVAVTARAEPSFYTARVAPIMEQRCVVCHGAEKKKAGLRLDTYEQVLRGGESGEVIKPGDLKGSELYRRITLPPDDDEVMPSDGKPHLTADEIKIIELWIASGASATKPLADFPNAPVPRIARAQAEPLAPDWRPHANEIAALERALGLKIVPRSRVPTDGLVVRTASAPGRCDDAALGKLAPIAALIVEAELARTKVTDAGIAKLGGCENLRIIDLTRTAVTSAGLRSLAKLNKLETINLTETAVDDDGVAQLKQLPALKRLHLFGTKTKEAAEAANTIVAK